MKTRYLPLFGVALSVPLFLFAALNYPGGNDWNTAEIGFHIAKNYVSALYQPKAINGSPNTARMFAIPAMLMLCVSLAFMFWSVSKRSQSKITGKSIEIFGIGAMVYTLLGVLTTMHDLLVFLAAVFFGIAVIAMIVSLHKAQQLWGVLAGLLCLALLIALGVMQHANFYRQLAPITEWSLFALSAVWVSFVYCFTSAPNNSFKPKSLRGSA